MSSIQTPAALESLIVYPESDGKPMAENTIQYDWITTIKANLDIHFADRDDVFVAGDLFWYPVKGQPWVRVAPDVLVALGRPRGPRPSYLQWKEDNVAPQVVFEIRSPSNTSADLVEKLAFYDRYAVEEYYLFDPDTLSLTGYRRSGQHLVEIPSMQGWASPLLTIRFEVRGDLILSWPDGQRFLTILERNDYRRRAEAARDEAEAARDEAEAARKKAELACHQAELACQQAELNAKGLGNENEKLKAKLRALGLDPNALD